MGSLMCVSRRIHLGGVPDKVPIRITCPKCKRRFRPSIMECGDPGCKHMYLPPHKPKKWWKKSVQRKYQPS